MGVKVRERKDGKWAVVIDHRRLRKTIVVGQKRAAETVAAKIQVRLAEGDSSALSSRKDGITVEKYASTWLAHVEKVLKPATHRFYEMISRLYIVAILGSTPITNIRRSHCREVLDAARAKGLKPKSLEGVARTLSSMLSQAVDDELLPANPAFRLGKHIGRKGSCRSTDIQPLTRDEATAFLAVAQEHAPDSYPFFLCALRTGMRLGELLGLEWGDLDFHGRFIEVRRNLTGGVEGTPKNGKSRRVDMSAQLADELKKLKTKRKEQKLANGWTELPSKVFCTPAGGPLDGDNVRHRVFYKMLEKGNLRHVRFHDLRHTFASLLLQNGENLMYVKEQLGHSSIQVTVDIYGHLIPGANRQAVDRLDDSDCTAGCPASVLV